MESFVGTSGWSYDWNQEGNLSWYIAHSGLNAVELNASFYRFPYPAYVKHWRELGLDLHWSVKVHRSITHHHKFNDTAVEIWERFLNRFMPLDDIIRFYLFQAPPRFQDIERIEHFLQTIHPDGRIAVELRDSSMLADDDLCRRLQQHAVLVSVDSPDFQNRIFKDRIIYLRLHGRDDWYQHEYTRQELEEILEIIYRDDPEQLLVFFNNNHHMLENARLMRSLLQSPEGM